MRATALAKFLVAWLSLASACAKHSPDSSSWLAFQGTPSSRGAIGWLSIGGPPGGELEEVRWVRGGTTKATDLLKTPEPWFVPTLGPLAWPAVFAIEGEDALVWSSSRGWGWASTRDERGHDALMRLEQVFASARDRMAQKQRDESGRTEHGSTGAGPAELLVVQVQPIRSAPRDDAKVVGHVPKLSSCGGEDERQHGAAAQVISTRGEWAEVIVATADESDPKEVFTRRLTWPSAPAGWVRLYEPGPVPGTRLRRWCVERWGPWP